jgi:acetylornithine deacetylase/succinyl-diaminopimelate desuccinylase-like protein
MIQRPLLFITMTSLLSGVIQAQSSDPGSAGVTRALAQPSVRTAVATIDKSEQRAVETLIALGSIVSPSGHEQQRAAWVAGRMREIGLKTVTNDSTPNVVGVIPGRSGKALVFVSTLDDLAPVAEFQRKAPRPPYREGDKVMGPGTNTSLTTAGMLVAAEALVKSGFRPEHDLVFAGVAQEETGLVGMKALYQQWKTKAVGFVDVLGAGTGISYGAMTIHWWKIVTHGPAGHSLQGGLPNVNQGIGRAVDRILSLPQPERFRDRRTVINVAMLQSGEVYNHKPDQGWFSLDLRSLDGRIVEEMERDVRTVLDSVAKETSVTFEMQPFQLTPGGQIPGATDSLLVSAAVAVSRHLGFSPTLSNAGSSNLNVPIGGGSLAVGVSGNRGGARGEAGEWADIPALMNTARHIVLLAGAMSTPSSGSSRNP